MSAQKTLVLYMQTLNQLAGEERYDLSPRLAELGEGLKANAETKVEQRHVRAYTGLGRLITRVLLSNYQARSVEAMVRDADDMLARWAREGDRDFDLHGEMMQLTLRIVGHTLDRIRIASPFLVRSFDPHTDEAFGK